MLLVHHVLEDARRRLAVIDGNASICEVAALLAEGSTPLVVVCDDDGKAVGVITRTDIVRAFGRSGGLAVGMRARSVMSLSIQSCSEWQSLQSLWETMARTAMRSTPVLDAVGRPQGILHVHDVARALVDEIVNEETLLRDYVMGVGYN